MQQATLKIDGMSCNHCVRAVDQALRGLAGVRIDELQIGSVAVSYDPAVIGVEQIEAAITEEGYTVAQRMESTG